MAYTDPVPTFAAGAKLTAAQMNTYLKDNLAFLVRPPACAIQGTGVSAGSGVTLDGTETYDTDGMHDNVTNPSRITIQTAGRYQCTATIQYAPNATGNRGGSLIVNGGTIYEGVLVPAASGNSSVCTVTRTLTLSVGDYIEARTFQTSGGNLTTTLLEFVVIFRALA